MIGIDNNVKVDTGFLAKILIFTISFLLLYGCTNLNSQVFSFGLKGGVNYSTVTDDYRLATDYKKGMNLGVFCQSKLHKECWYCIRVQL